MGVVPNTYSISIKRKAVRRDTHYVYTVTHFGHEVASGERNSEVAARLDAMEQVVHDLGAETVWEIGGRT